jgi:ribonuclease HII
VPWHVGIDENGLGPQLGPLVVTSVMARVTDAAHRALHERAASFLHERLDDSKALVAHGDVTLGEAWARAVAKQCGLEVASPDGLVEALALHPRTQRLQKCAGAAAEQCWSTEAEAFAASEAQLAQADADLQALAHRGLEVSWARCNLVCVRALNDARQRGIGRFDADLHAMEELIVGARSAADGELEAVCGKVGGLQRYVPSMRILGDRLHVVLGEERACSAYRFPGIGTVQFVRDADGAHPLVALASLVGKYVRELLMARIVRFYQRQVPELAGASGYNDPVTDRFVRSTRSLRRKSGVPTGCFRRAQATSGERG